MAKHGSKLLRHLLWNAARFNPACRKLYERMIKKGKHPAAAYGAVMRKLVQLVFGVLKSGESFNPKLNT